MSEPTDEDIGTSCSTDKGCADPDEELCIDGRLWGGDGREMDLGPCPCYCHSDTVWVMDNGPYEEWS